MKQTKLIILIIVLIISNQNLKAQLGNTLYGTNAGASITSGDSVTAFGINAGQSLTTGFQNVFIGSDAGKNATTLVRSVYIGHQAGLNSITNSDNTFIGHKAGFFNTAFDNTFVGKWAGYNNTSGNDNTFIGSEAGLNNTTGNDNTFLGEQAGRSNTTGTLNTFIGNLVGFNNTSGRSNTFIGSRSETTDSISFNVGNLTTGNDNTTGTFNVFIGNGVAALNKTGSYNTIIGTRAGEYTSSDGNTIIGSLAGAENGRINSPTARFNTYLGYRTGTINQDGYNNVGIGARAEFGSTDVSNSTFIGCYATVNAHGATVFGSFSSVTGVNGIAIGKNSSATAANSIAIGYQTTANVANEIVIGNASHTAIGGSVNWTATSDERFKTNVKENVVGLDFINALRPVTYNFDTEKLFEHNGQNLPEDLECAIDTKNAIRYTGFLAQEVETAAENVGFDFSGVDKRILKSDIRNPMSETTENQTSDSEAVESRTSEIYGLRYAEFVVPLVKAVQELSKENTELTAQIEQLKEQNQQDNIKLSAQIEDLKNKNQQYEAALQSLIEKVEALEKINQ